VHAMNSTRIPQLPLVCISMNEGTDLVTRIRVQEIDKKSTRV
jgi:hypothetical protein